MIRQLVRRPFLPYILIGLPMIRLSVSILFLLLAYSASGQGILKGEVRDSESDQPVPLASIFLNNTSTGTKTDQAGKFELKIPAGRFELIVSSIGYQTSAQSIDAEQIPNDLVIRLQPRSAPLETVVIEPFLKDGWEKWGSFFLENFIGSSAFATECRIRNPEVLRFRHSKKQGVLTVIALEPLVIENKALGYILHYQMEGFSFDFRNRYLMYTGYPFFEEMKGGASRQKKWRRNRSEAYHGSMLHFMRSVYLNRVREEGFDVRRLRKLPNLEKQRVKNAYRSNLQTTTSADGTRIVTQISKDTADYYDRIMRQKDYQDEISRDLLPGDSIAYALGPTVAALEFPDYLLVIYKHKLAPEEYTRHYPESSTAMMSQLTLPNGGRIELYANGSYYDPEDLLNLGYWSWSEKIATMLPVDYQASAK